MAIEDDRDLLNEIDDHAASCNEYEATRVAKLLKHVTGSRLTPARSLHDHDRKWAEDLLEQLDGRL